MEENTKVKKNKGKEGGLETSPCRGSFVSVADFIPEKFSGQKTRLPFRIENHRSTERFILTARGKAFQGSPSAEHSESFHGRC